MPALKLINKVALTEEKKLNTLVENRSVFSLDFCELNVFESYQETYRVPLSFNDFVITSMVRGKKVMHLDNRPQFEYFPGETVIAPAKQQMVIDFPEANMQNPTQCIALAVDSKYVMDTLNFLDNYYKNDGDKAHQWKLQFNQYHFTNNDEVTGIINKLIRTCRSDERVKNIYADLSLKELLIRLVQSQYLFQVKEELCDQKNSSRMHFVLDYIREHLTEKIGIDTLTRKAYLSRSEFFRWFKEQFGLTPLDYINQERIRLAKQMLADRSRTVTEVCSECGFNDVNYFVRTFKKIEGITPGAYKTCLMAS